MHLLKKKKRLLKHLKFLNISSEYSTDNIKKVEHTRPNICITVRDDHIITDKQQIWCKSA